jgi:sugar/nucleoside kinase (ribokinase family)
MATEELSVTGIGNAIVDILSHADDDFIANEGYAKGSMSLIDAPRALALSAHLTHPRQSSGGSAANTIAGLSSLGSKVGYIGKVAQDELGQAFSSSMTELGVEFRTTPSDSGTPTARCIVLVSPDAQRTMCTYLGACVELTPKDVDSDLIARSHITYLEGYLWDPPQAKEAFLAAAEIAHANQRLVSLSLSDSFCVSRHHDSFLHLVENHVDVLFANESELLSLYPASDVNASMAIAKTRCRIAAVTCGERGCLIAFDGNVFAVPAEPVARVVDTTGAGDLFAAGFLHGLSTGKSPEDCALLGSLSAAEIISHFGARPESSLMALAQKRLG